MPHNNIQLNPRIVNAVMTVGAEKTPVIVIDNFILDSNSLVEYVSERVSFDSEKHTYYPGVRAKINDEYANFVVDMLGERLLEPFAVPNGFKPVYDSGYYSLVATPPDKLLPQQCRPHSDSARPHYLAIMHYLSSGSHGGTGFFRHRRTGFEKITANRIQEYSGSVVESDKVHGNPPQGYIAESTDQYELIGKIDYKPNRVIIYPGCLLHSGLINPETDISKDPERGRLTANVFLDFAPSVGQF